MRAFKTFTAVSVLALVAVSYSASAQDLETPQDAADAADQREIIVTGSRLGRSTFNSPTPVTVISGETIQALGQVNIGETIQSLPQNISKASETNTGINIAANLNAGANIADLRGLNPNNGVRTLTMVDTRRFVPSTTGGAVDTNLIPSMLVKTVETVTGGASAAYGTEPSIRIPALWAIASMCVNGAPFRTTRSTTSSSQPTSCLAPCVARTALTPTMR